jgi:hypothetical protein
MSILPSSDLFYSNKINFESIDHSSINADFLRKSFAFLLKIQNEYLLRTSTYEAASIKVMKDRAAGLTLDKVQLSIADMKVAWKRLYNIQSFGNVAKKAILESKKARDATMSSTGDVYCSLVVFNKVITEAINNITHMKKEMEEKEAVAKVSKDLITAKSNSIKISIL